MYDSIYPPDYYILEHHGIIGQKWGGKALPEF